MAKRKRVKPDVQVKLTAIMVDCPRAEPVLVRQAMWDVLHSQQRTDNLLGLAVATLANRLKDLGPGEVIGGLEEGISNGP
jgi:hypothetical protein